MSKQELIEELIGGEPNFKRIDGALSSVHDRYAINDSIILSMVLYSHLIAFAFKDTDEAVVMVGELLQEYSSYELGEIAKTLLGVETIEFYKEILFADHALSENPIIKALEESEEALGGSVEELDAAYARITELMEDQEEK